MATSSRRCSRSTRGPPMPPIKLDAGPAEPARNVFAAPRLAGTAGDRRRRTAPTPGGAGQARLAPLPPGAAPQMGAVYILDLPPTRLYANEAHGSLTERLPGPGPAGA